MKYNINFSSLNRVKEKQRLVVNLIYALIFLILIIFAFSGMKRAGDLLSEIDRIKNEGKSLEERIGKEIEERRKFASDEEIKTLIEKLTFYSTIYSDRLYTTNFLSDLEDIIPSGVVLKNIDIDLNRKNFVLIGESLSPEGAVSFSKKIQGVNYIKKIEISRQSFQRVGDKKILINEFEIKGELY